MNNQLKLPWTQNYRETLSISRPALVAAILENIQKVEHQLHRTGRMRPQQELGRGYAEFVARRNSLR